MSSKAGNSSKPSTEANKLPNVLSFSLIPRQLDQEKISILEKRVKDLYTANEELRLNATKNERDTHDLVLYFQREIDMKDEIIVRLNEEIVRREQQIKSEIIKIQKKFDEELLNTNTSTELIINDLKNKVQSLEIELSSVDLYRSERDTHEARIQQLDKSLQEQRQQLFEALDEQERRFLEEKVLLLKNLEDQKLVFREISLKEARLAMGEEAKKILSDNAHLQEELRFHHAASASLQAEKLDLSNELKVVKRDLSIVNEKELEYARLLHSRSKEIKQLQEKIEGVQAQHAVYIHTVKDKAKAFRSETSKELDEAAMDNSGLRRLLQIKNKELRHMKVLSATILQQRTETEQFFLEALSEVKEIIKSEKRVGGEPQGRIDGNIEFLSRDAVPRSKDRAMLPPLTGGYDTTGTHKIASEEVTLRELSWADKELVLRVLFSKINANQRPMPDRASGRK